MLLGNCGSCIFQSALEARRQALRNHLASDGLRNRLGRQRHGSDPPHLLPGLVRCRVVGFAQGGQEKSGDVVDVDTGIEFGRLLGDLPVE